MAPACNLNGARSTLPGTVGLIGFDNSLTLNRESRLPFSSVDMELVGIGRAAAQALAASSGEITSGRHLVPGTLVHPVHTL